MVAAGDTSILHRVMGFDRADMPAEAARFVLTLGFIEADKLRMSELSNKASNGSLNDVEAREIDAYILASDVLTIFQLKARIALSGTSESR